MVCGVRQSIFQACPTQLLRITHRPWGVADLKFFSDDSCTEVIEEGAALFLLDGLGNFLNMFVYIVSFLSS